MKDNYKLEILSDKKLTIDNIKVNIIKPSDMFNKWPKINKMGGICYKRGTRYTMWSVIVEHYILCVKTSKYVFKHMWMIEQDLDYSGNLYDFLRKYEKNEEDVILKEWRIQKPSFWPECFTPEYYMWRIKYHYNYKIQSYNWITRLSNKAINVLYNEFELGRHVANEEAIPERIKPFKLTYCFFKKSNYGYKFRYFSRVNKSEWKYINSNILHRNKLFHALKF